MNNSKTIILAGRLLLLAGLFLLPTQTWARRTRTDKIRVKTGIEVLKAQHFRPLQGKRVGLITNPTGVDNTLRSTIDLLYEAPGVQLVALYGPEHGVRGNQHAGESVTDVRDEATGLPIHSLYGKTRKATPEMVRGLDALVYDIQDIGCRSYTYISTMGLAMEVAAEQDLEFIVLDRPNPLGGWRVEGCDTFPPTAPEFFSLSKCAGKRPPIPKLALLRAPLWASINLFYCLYRERVRT